MTRSAQAGFTLLELLVVLVVCGLLFAGLTNGFRFGVLALTAQARMDNGFGDFEAADRTLRHLVEAMEPSNDTDGILFTASRDQFTCVTEMPQPSGSPARAEASILLRPDHHLVVHWRAVPRRGPTPAIAAETDLLGGVAHIELSYWRARGGWTNTWRSPESPGLIRIHLQPRPSERTRHWPDIIVAPVLQPR
ncbi:MAG: prepilin-type N-terminal cleavage/methylation domain-containing protein [Acetobacteraceae bacterium]|nr:prepilin-type N-terminal cleavage/methylation domain-containing protein [Acetobacteraceae bacterium]